MCDDSICICLSIGCSNRLKPEGDGQARVCPRCHNAQVFAVKNTKCLEICCVPLVPLGSDRIWHCQICQWQASQSGPAPPLPMQGYQHPGGGGGGGYGGGPPGGYAPQQQMQMQPQMPMQQGYGGGGYQQPGYGPQQGYH